MYVILKLRCENSPIMLFYTDMSFVGDELSYRMEYLHFLQSIIVVFEFFSAEYNKHIHIDSTFLVTYYMYLYCRFFFNCMLDNVWCRNTNLG